MRKILILYVIWLVFSSSIALAQPGVKENHLLFYENLHCLPITYKGGAPLDPRVITPSISAEDPVPFKRIGSANDEINSKIELMLKGELLDYYGTMRSNIWFLQNDGSQSITKEQMNNILTEAISGAVCQGSNWNNFQTGDNMMQGFSYFPYPKPYMTTAMFECGLLKVEITSSCDAMEWYPQCYSTQVRLIKNGLESSFLFFDLRDSLLTCNCYTVNDASWLELIHSSANRIYKYEGDYTSIGIYSYFHDLDYKGTFDNITETWHEDYPLNDAQIPGLIKLSHRLEPFEGTGAGIMSRDIKKATCPGPSNVFFKQNVNSLLALPVN